jgi:putative membrane protein insertion efficiency factor
MPTASRETRRSLAPFLLAALAGLAIGDAVKPPQQQWGARLAIGGIDAYRATLSGLFERTGLIRCRFQPTCSAYGREAIRRYGLPKGVTLAAARILRCNPFAKGGADPVP